MSGDRVPQCAVLVFSSLNLETAMTFIRGLEPVPSRAVVASDRLQPSERFRQPDEAMDPKRWLERDLAAGAKALRYLDTEEAVHRERHVAARRKRTKARGATIRLDQSISQLWGTSIWGL